MICYIKWKVINLENKEVSILLNSWIWYDIFINDSTKSFLNLWEIIELYIYHHISENAQNLFGFLKIEEKEVFKGLIKISWIWGKVALNILDLWINNLIVAVKNEDKNTIEQIKGIWKKTASKIILELKDKDFIKLSTLQNQKKDNNLNIDEDIFNQIKITLVNMWYNAKKIEEILYKLPKDMIKTWEIIQYVIKNI